MIIVKVGKIPEENTIEATCNICGTVAKGTRSEFKMVGAHQFNCHWEAPCPVCPGGRLIINYLP